MPPSKKAKKATDTPGASPSGSSAKEPRKRGAGEASASEEPATKQRKKIMSLKDQPIPLTSFASVKDQNDKDIMFLFACIQYSDIQNPNYREIGNQLNMTYMSASGRYNTIRKRVMRIVAASTQGSAASQESAPTHEHETHDSDNDTANKDPAIKSEPVSESGSIEEAIPDASHDQKDPAYYPPGAGF
ncbi:hypothetical protein N7468_001456 [Penicillium chermesinum]|uniref:Myb-like DNA-binding domain-containing protein n=1 Tax=Penicillium chermesinum TaxID=63820 RepID=A0A9W9TXD0_9EURO|nr:uncharacterized protein N7468_001456 [Penicillium chermesinum]KAJ5246473.1 hypothetical protein N7468_001456 [Penicillium chermesinum]